MRAGEPETVPHTLPCLAFALRHKVTDPAQKEEGKAAHVTVAAWLPGTSGCCCVPAQAGVQACCLSDPAAQVANA